MCSLARGECFIYYQADGRKGTSCRDRPSAIESDILIQCFCDMYRNKPGPGESIRIELVLDEIRSELQGREADASQSADVIISISVLCWQEE